jgi:hypothetical protein
MAEAIRDTAAKGMARKEPAMSDEVNELIITLEEMLHGHAEEVSPEEPKPAKNRQVGGDHYKKLGAYQPWEVLEHWLTTEEFRGYMKGTAIAYLAREKDKGGNIDIAKATHTLQGFLETLTKE